MNSKRPNLDAVNAGRQRRSYTPLEQLNRSLDSLEQRLERNRGDNFDASRDASHRYAAPSYDDRSSPQPYRAIARDIERVRRDEDGFAAFGKIAGELNGLREELRGQMAASVRREFDELRQDFRSAGAQAGRSDERGINMLRLEMEQMKGALDSLAREETVQSFDRRWDDFDRRFNDFEHRVSHGGQPHAAELAALTDRIEQIGRAVGSLPESLSLRALEDKVRTLAGALDQFIAHQDGHASQTFSHIEERLDEISRAIVSATIAAQKHLDLAPFEKIEGRISALARQIEEVMDDGSDADVMEHLRGLTRRVDEVAQRIDERQADSGFDDRADAAIRGLEAKLDGISRRLEESTSQFAGIDPDLVRGLEAQVAGLSEHLSRPSTPLPEFVDISPRLREIEKSIAENRESVLEAARAAAETAARSLASSQPNAVAGLAEEVKALESLTRSSDERNTKTFEAIHDTLLKIVDRMGSLERDGVRGFGRKLEVTAPPSLDTDDMFPADEPKAIAAAPREAADEPATEKVADKAAELDQAPGGMGSMLGRLSRAFSKKEAAETAEAAEPQLAGSVAISETVETAAPEVNLDAPLDPRIANQPLEPGSGAPDLHAIMKRVRDERTPAGRTPETDAGKSDFIAAARRAAQAAAAEAEARKKTADGGVRVLRIGDLLKSRRKHLLLGAAVLITALAGAQYGRTLLIDGTTTSSITQPAPAKPAAPEKHGAASPEALPPLVAKPEEKAASAAHEVAKVAPAKPQLAGAFTADENGYLSENAFAARAPMDNAAVAALSTIEPAASEVAALPLKVPAEIGTPALRDAAESGDPKAFHEIATRYAEGIGGVTVDMMAAASWYEKAAELGFAPAQYRIGNMYEKGLGVDRDLQKARGWYEQAAEAGNASAMHNLAVLYAMGVDGPADNKLAAKWFVKAAELGVKDSQFNLGILAARGVGVEQSLEQSYKWFALVAKTGDNDAASKRDEIGKALKPEQLDRARASAELWKAKPLDPTANATDVPTDWQDTPRQTASLDATGAVKTVQQILNDKGYDAGSADGVIGGKTKAAITRFQKDNGLDVTGSVDANLVRTLAALN